MRGSRRTAKSDRSKPALAPLHHFRARARRPPPPPLRASRRARSAAPSQRSSSARRVTPPSSAKRPPRPSALSCRRHAPRAQPTAWRTPTCRLPRPKSSDSSSLEMLELSAPSPVCRHSPLLLAATSSAQRRPGHGRCCAEETATRRRHGTPSLHGQCAAIGCDQQLASLRAGGLESRPAGRGG